MSCMCVTQENDMSLTVKVEERLRHALVPRYQQLFTLISRMDTGIKFLVDLRADLLVRSRSSPLHNLPLTKPNPKVSLHALHTYIIKSLIIVSSHTSNN